MRQTVFLNQIYSHINEHNTNKYNKDILFQYASDFCQIIKLGYRHQEIFRTTDFTRRECLGRTTKSPASKVGGGNLVTLDKTLSSVALTTKPQHQ